MEIRRRLPTENLETWVRALPELFASNTAVTADVFRAARRGLVRRVAPRLYTTNQTDPMLLLVARWATTVASLRYPGAVISHRSAFELSPAEGLLFLTGRHEATDVLPGLTIRVIRGPGPLAGDTPFLQLHRSSDARAYLENLKRTRRTGRVSRALERSGIESRLEETLRSRGEAGLNAIRHQARAIAPALDAEDAFETLDGLIGTLLSTRSERLTAPQAIARAAGVPYDERRVALLDRLAGELHGSWAPTRRPSPVLLREARQNRAFVDAYFSNYIEGTEFEIDEARQIVFEDRTPPERPQDAHDVRGTFELLNDERQMSLSAASLGWEDFVFVLKRGHATILGGRPEKRPGEFKTVLNRAGETSFVAPDLVEGTLRKGFDVFKSLGTPFQRAAFMMFLVAEVHPFDDGNGRLARAMMNAELGAGEESHIIVTTVYRSDYLGVSRKLSRAGEPNPFVRMLDRAHEFTWRLRFDDLDTVLATLRACNAFDDTGMKILLLPPLPQH